MSNKLSSFWKIEKKLINDELISQLDYVDVVKNFEKFKSSEKHKTIYFYISGIYKYEPIATKIYTTLENHFEKHINYNRKEKEIFIKTKKLIKSIDSTVDEKSIIYSYLTLWVLNAIYLHNLNSVRDVGKFTWISRYEIINNIVKMFKNWSFSLTKLVCDANLIKHNLFLFSWTVVQLLINDDVVLVKNLKTQDGTEILIKGNRIMRKNIESDFLKIYKKPCTLEFVDNEIYHYREHYSTLQKLIRPNKFNHAAPVFEDFKYLQNKINTKLFVRKEVLDQIKFQYEQKFNISLNSLKNIWKKWRKMKQKKKTTAQYLELYKLQFFVVFYNNYHEFENGFYYDYFYDFRGRVYTDSPISYTYDKIIRCCLSYGEYSSDEIQELEKKDTTQLLPYFSQILNSVNLKDTYKNINFNLNIIKIYVVTVFFELGKLNKNKVSACLNGRLSFMDFINEGIEVFKKNQYDLENFEFVCNVISLKDVLNCLNQNKFVKVVVFKDATASAIQLLGLLLQIINFEFLQECNLISNEFWFDTYTCFLNRFYSQLSTPIPEKFASFFSRSSLKKTMMTFNYNASLKTCWKDFCEFLKRPSSLTFEDNNELYFFFKLFYNFIKKTFNSNAFFKITTKQLTKNIMDLIADTYFLKTLDEFLIPIGYYKIKTKRVDRIFINKRSTISYNILTKTMDENQTKRALKANLVHSLDAYIIRQVERHLGRSVITIHDSFGIDILNTFLLIKIINQEYSNFAVNNPFIKNNDINKLFVELNASFVVL